MKFMKVLLVVLVMAAMAAPVIAEDRLTLYGSLQVRGQIYSVDKESTYAEYTSADVIAGREAREGALRQDIFDAADALYVDYITGQTDAVVGHITSIGDAEDLFEDLCIDADDCDDLAEALLAYHEAITEGFDPGYEVGDMKTDKFDEDYAWNDMRMRIGGKIAVAEGVSVHFRFDTSESPENSSDPLAWGGDNQYSARRADIQFDKAYLEIVKNGFTLQAGQLYLGGFSPTQSIMDYTAPGFIVKYGDFTIAHGKRFDENVGIDSDAFPLNKDGDSSETAIKYVFKGDGFTLQPAIAYNYDDSSADCNFLSVGLSGSLSLGAAALKGEVVYFDGEADKYRGKTVTGADLQGLNIWLDGSMDVNDMVKIGLAGFYAPEQDGSGEIQIYHSASDSVTDWAFVDYNPQHYGAYAADFVYTDNWSIWDPSGKSAGVIAGQIYADVKANEDLGFKFAAMYFEPADDGIAGADMSGYSLDAGLSYKLAPNTTIASHLNYLVLDNDDYDYEDEYLGIITGLTVSF